MKLYNKIEEYFPLFIFIIICTAMLMQVFSRTLFDISFSWNIEFSRYAQVWLTFIGIGFVHKRNEHIKISLLSDRIENFLTPKGKSAFYIIKSVISLTFITLLIVMGFMLSVKSWNFRSSAMQLRQFWLYICVPLGAVAYLIREIMHIRKYFNARGNS